MFHWIDQDKKDYIRVPISKKEFSKRVSAHPQPTNLLIKVITAQINPPPGLPFLHLLLPLIPPRPLTKPKDNHLPKITIFPNEKTFLFLQIEKLLYDQNW